MLKIRFQVLKAVKKHENADGRGVPLWTRTSRVSGWQRTSVSERCSKKPPKSQTCPRSKRSKAAVTFRKIYKVQQRK